MYVPKKVQQTSRNELLSVLYENRLWRRLNYVNYIDIAVKQNVVIKRACIGVPGS
jgi:hypothetical protein